MSELLTYEDLEKRCLEGYAYQIGTQSKPGERRSMVALTGVGGAKMYLKACERAGIPAILVDLYVNTDMGLHRIVDLKVTKKSDINL